MKAKGLVPDSRICFIMSYKILFMYLFLKQGMNHANPVVSSGLERAGELRTATGGVWQGEFTSIYDFVKSCASLEKVHYLWKCDFANL